MNPRLRRALLLYEQERFDHAAQELRMALVDEPNNGVTHAVLALCLSKQEKYEEATSEARNGIHLAPDLPYSHYAYANVLYDRNHFSEAEAAIREAIQMDPYDPDFRGKLAQICFSQRRWQDALDAAEEGLAIDPEKRLCLNIRTLALVKLGRKADAGDTIRAALEKNPDDATTHTVQGWTLIEQGNPKQALDHFREALRLDPTSDWAKHGIVEALKSKNFVYRILLSYFLWTAKLSSRAQWMILLGGYFGQNILKAVARQNPELAPFVLPLLILYVAFAVMTWIAYPLFNLLLRLDRTGRLALSPTQIRQANWVGIWLLMGIIFLIIGLATRFEGAILLAIVFGGTLPALAAIFLCDTGWPRKTMFAITAGLFLVGLCATVLDVMEPFLAKSNGEAVRSFARTCIGLFAFGVIGSQFAANYLMSATVRK